MVKYFACQLFLKMAPSSTGMIEGGSLPVSPTFFLQLWHRFFFFLPSLPSGVSSWPAVADEVLAEEGLGCPSRSTEAEAPPLSKHSDSVL